MDMVAHLDRLFAYDLWANQQILTSLGAIDNPPRRSVEFQAHILSAQRLWWQRIAEQAQTLAVWPDLSLQECAWQAAELAAIWKAYLGTMDEAGLSNSVTYRNSRGESWTSKIEDILQHVILHSAYHRGQIAIDMRAAGLVPAYTDFIHAVRQKNLE
jgi:uncharacterized damage-inducible protein DinB